MRLFRPLLWIMVAFTPTPLAGFAEDAKIQGGNPDDWMPWRDPNNPSVHLLNPDDPMTADWNARRDTSNDPKREPGLYSPQRYAFQWQSISGFPTFFGTPIAMTTEDLKAGKVEVAVVGLTTENQPVRGEHAAGPDAHLPGRSCGAEEWHHRPLLSGARGA